MADGDLQTPRVIVGRYELHEQLGSGGMGTVWRATDTVLARDVAIKEVRFPRGVTEEERELLRERTRREARAAARLDHPSAVTVYDVAEEDGVPYLVMELVQARTLSEVVRTDGRLSPHATAQLGLAVLGALEAAHEEGIVHRDVKPGNVLLRDDGRVVLTDFGIATFTGDSSITSTGLLLGSPSYIAPERARGEAPGPASDLWSLGATLFTAVEGTAPYDKGDPLPTMTAVVSGDRAPFVAAGPLVPALQGLLEADPALRLDAAGAREALTEVLSTPDALSVQPTGAPDLAPAAERTSAMSVEDVQEDLRPAPVRSYAPPRVIRDDTARRSRTLVPALALGAVAVTGVAFGIASQGGLGGEDRGPAPRSSASAQATTAAALPDGWQPIGGEGSRGSMWRTGVPASYDEGSFNGAPQWKDRATGRTLRVITTAAKSDATANQEERATAFARTHDDYEQVRIEPVDFRGYPAAEWEFTYRDGGAALHAVDRYFVAAGAGYSLFFQTRGSDDWAAARRDFEQIAASFQP